MENPLNIHGETIHGRRSVRTYRNEPLPEETLAGIRAMIDPAVLPAAPFGNDISLRVIPVQAGRSSEGRKLGTYGYVKGEAAFLVGTCANRRAALLDYGYVFEQVVLALTEMGIGTCWLGGSFKRDTFNEEITLVEGEIIPAVSPLGIASDPSLRERGMRLVVRAVNRKPWEELFYHTNFSHTLTSMGAGSLAPAFEAVRLGPSAVNKQPWRLVYDPEGGRVHLYLLHTSTRTKEKAPLYDMQLLDGGIAMAHLTLGAGFQGMDGKWVMEDPGLEPSDVRLEYLASFVLG